MGKHEEYEVAVGPFLHKQTVLVITVRGGEVDPAALLMWSISLSCSLIST